MQIRGQTPFFRASEKWGLTPVFFRAAPFAAFIALLALQPWLERFADARWIAVSRGLAAGALLILFWRHYSELRAPAGGPRLALRDAGAAIATGLAVFAAWITFDWSWATFESGPGLVPLDGRGQVEAGLVAAKLAGLVLVVPLMEELFWRSLVMRWIDRRDFLALDARTASLAAVAISSALFALEHTLWLAGLAAGAAYALLYRRSGNLWSAVAAHATTNAALAAHILATGRWDLW